MLPRLKAYRGTTFAELLVAVVFVGVAAAAILGSVSGSYARSIYAKRRALALSQARSELERIRAQARSTSLVAGSVMSTVSPPGFGGSAVVQRSVTAVSGSTNLFTVSIKVSWSERAFGSPRPDEVLLETVLRSPDG